MSPFFQTLSAVSLIGPTLSLEPLTLAHASALFRVCTPEVFRWMIDWPRDASFEAFEAYEREVLTWPNTQAFVMLDRATGETLGTTAYLDIRSAHRALEIGRTWVAPARQGGRANPESKFLLLRHAFEELGALRVQLKTDARNLHSQRAIEKLGARREGVLRNYQIRADGTPRDTVMYAITADDWPEVRAGLLARLG